MRKQVMGFCAAAFVVSGFGSVPLVSAASSAAPATNEWLSTIIGLDENGEENSARLSNDINEETKDMSSNASDVGPSNNEIEKVIANGLKYVGTPYEFGSNRSTVATFDCSDFVQWIFKESLEVSLPADSRQQGKYVKDSGAAESDWHNLKRGDLMFFMSYKGTGEENYRTTDKSTEKITHVGIYLGNGQILHTYSKESGGVHVDEFADTAWEQRFLFGGSVIAP